MLTVGKPTVISTFAGTGGSSLGYHWAGFKELLAIDFDDHAVECFKLNFPDVPVWEKSVIEVTGNEIMNFCKIRPGELDVFDGSPPCQGFSTAGKRQVNDPRNDLFNHYIRLVTELQPKVFVMENVTGMAKGKMKGRFIEIMNVLKTGNYNVKCKQMNAMYYGVPQSRERLIFIGVRKDLEKHPVFPMPSNKLITAKMAISYLEHENILEDIALQTLKVGQKRYPFGSSEMRIYPNKPIGTVTKNGGTNGGNTDIHYSKNRNLTVQEIKVLCSFPETWKLPGRDRQAIDRLGNAVMPKFMQAIATTINEKILENEE